ncbi:TetR/AcrR family transcriptional regulator [Streptomyces durocortorensis]|uniref:TetR/AcrR family transcriptional regulator n=1 Tax=Streptomyces durocortorensis TaxID=2811104 RepID=A0ABS2HUA5_9ACTN|nr:TetR/AcrR family transcriptional regulator [Streptomyces durocortorensis]MBM7054310.1 TetR/AcrR family transcriptional regulator [Streptomyces durocortorensis]
MSAPEEAPHQAEPAPARPRARRRTGTYRAADQRRGEILDAAVRQFARKGYLSTSMQKVAEDVGISHTGLLHHFPSKRHLLMAVLEAREDQAVTRFYGELDPQAPDVVRLLGLVAAQSRLNVSQPGLMQMYAVLAAEAGSEEHPAHAYFQQRYERVITVIDSAILHGITAGVVIPGTDGRAVAREMLAVADGLQIQWALSGGSLDLPAAHREYLDRVCRRITVSGQGLGPAD